MNRLTVLQLIIDKIEAKNYLEIGVFKGNIISNISCQNKIGVDPEFKLRAANKVKKLLPSRRFKTFEYTSDIFLKLTQMKSSQEELM